MEGDTLARIFWYVAFATAGMTAFYMMRCVAMTFWGDSHVDPKLDGKVHEPGGWIGFALFVLAIASTLGGFLNVPEFLGAHAILGHFTGLHVSTANMTPEELDALHAGEWTSMFLSLAIAGAGLAVGYLFYRKGSSLPATFRATAPGAFLGKLSENKFYVDEIYAILIVRPFEALSQLMHTLIDQVLIDRLLVGGSALIVRGFGELARRMQTGFIPGYLLTFGCGALVLIYILLNHLAKGGAQ